MDFYEAMREITQSRSNYQLEKFVVGQHHTPEMQYYQLVLEASALTNSLKNVKLQIKKLDAEITELNSTGKKSDEVEAEIKQLSIFDLEHSIIGAERELKYLTQLFDQYPKFTRQEIESAQKEYWETRLTRTAQFQMLSRQGGVDWAQLEALQQANFIEDGLAQIPTFNYITNTHNKLQIGEKDD